MGSKFLRHWQCIGIKKNIDITKPYVCNIGDLPLVVWKNTDNQWLSTINICKHMGSKLDQGKIVNGCLHLFSFQTPIFINYCFFIKII
jgi:phenylpropionate dioxygenase-like ring-hydroxylating dioxygenase large terminal subunit